MYILVLFNILKLISNFCSFEYLYLLTRRHDVDLLVFLFLIITRDGKKWICFVLSIVLPDFERIVE